VGLLRQFLPKKGLLLPRHQQRTLFNLASNHRHVTKRLTLLSPPQQTMDVIADVASYSEFLPFCTASDVLHPDPGNANKFQANLKFEWGTFKEVIRHQVTVNREGFPSSVVSVAEESRIAKSVRYTWHFEPTETNGTAVTVELGVEFNNIMHAAVFDLQIDQISNEMINCFKDRINTAHLLKK